MVGGNLVDCVQHCVATGVAIALLSKAHSSRKQKGDTLGRFSAYVGGYFSLCSAHTKLLCMAYLPLSFSFSPFCRCSVRRLPFPAPNGGYGPAGWFTHTVLQSVTVCLFVSVSVTVCLPVSMYVCMYVWHVLCNYSGSR